MNILYSICAFVVAIGVLVTVHEFGHYWVARRFGIKVLKFSIGFGRALWSRRYGADGTEYTIAMIPLGGYVKMLDESEAEVAPHERHRAFNRQSLPVRSAVVVAGPAFNFLFAILAYCCMYMLGVEGLRPVVDDVESGSIAAQAGFRTGDEIESIRDIKTSTWQSAVQSMIAASFEEEPINIKVVDSSGQPHERIMNLETSIVDDLSRGQFFERIGFVPARPSIPAVLGRIEPGHPAERDGFRTGDRVLEADGMAVTDWSNWVRIVRERPGKTFNVVVERDGGRTTLSLTPNTMPSADGTQFGRIGAGVDNPEQFFKRFYVTERYSLWPALTRGIAKTGEISALTLHMLWKMVLLEVSVENLSGPIRIAEYAGVSARSGVARFLAFLGVLSVSLGILNLLPIPMLDGGHLFYYIVEFVQGRPVSETTQLFGQRLGIALLVGLMALVFYNDLQHILG